MSDYKTIDLMELVNLAQNASGEIGALSDGTLINYETGQQVYFVDENTALFLASAREIVLELARRIRAIENPYGHLSKLQWDILMAARSEYGTSVGTWEETKLRQAFQLTDEGLLKKEFNSMHGRSWTFYVSIEGQKVLKTKREAAK